MTSQPEFPDIPQTMLQFQSVGDNCEFGVVQRYCGIEPSGLFRFSTSSISNLIDALDESFASYGSEGDLEIIPGPGNFYWCRSLRYGFGRSTNEVIGTVEPTALREREYGKVAHLKASLLKDLAEGRKIFVRKGTAQETFDEFLSLATAIRRHGPAVILRVEVAPSPAEVGAAVWVSPGILRGYVRRFSPYEGGMRIDLEPWVDLCRNALALVAGDGPPPTRYAPSTSIRLLNRAARHITRRSQDRFTSFRREIDPRSIVPGAVTVFSAWVWLPTNFRAEQVFALVKAANVYVRLANRDADLGIRAAWQRIWISAQIPPGCSMLVIGLGVTGEPSQRFWSTDWRIGEGPVPPPAPSPSMTIRRSIADWFRR